MSLTLHYHPLSSFCWKALIGLYENDTPFTPLLVDLGDAASRQAFAEVWPLTKFPVLQDDARGEIVPESSVILDYLDLHYPGPAPFTPAGDAAWRTRLWDRVFDNYIHLPMQRIVADRLRPQGQKDAQGVADAQAQITRAYALVEAQTGGREWITGDTFGLADCAACPALYYGDRVAPLGSDHPGTAAYFERLKARASFARVLVEAEPYFKFFPA